MSKNEVQKYTEQEKMLQEAGMENGDYQPDTLSLPQIKIDIDKPSKGMKSKYYLDDGVPVDLGLKIKIRPVLAQHVRAIFKEGEETPHCSGINGKALQGTEPKNCNGCPLNNYGTECKAKVRLFCAVEVNSRYLPASFLLPPTSIKHWDRHVSRLLRNEPRALPYFACGVEFGLNPVEKKGYIWNEVNIGPPVILKPADLKEIIDLRKQVMEISGTIDPNDYSEKGDRVSEDTPIEPVKANQGKTDEIPF